MADRTKPGTNHAADNIRALVEHEPASDERDHLNLQVDLLSEQEMTIVLRMLRRISERLGIPHDEEESRRAEILGEHTDVLAIAEEIRDRLPGER